MTKSKKFIHKNPVRFKDEYGSSCAMSKTGGGGIALTIYLKAE